MADPILPPDVLDDAVAAYMATNRAIEKRKPGRRMRAVQKYDGPTVDDILRAHGIRYGDDPSRWMAAARMVHAKATEAA